MSLRDRVAGTAATVALAGGVVAALTTATGVTFSAFAQQTANPGSVISAAPDFRAPAVSSTFIAKTIGGTAGAIKPAGTYYVYANVSDTGNPASGVSTVRADLSSFDTGITAAALTAGSFTAGGVAYGYRSASLTADTPKANGSYAYSLTATDVAANTGTQTGFAVTMDGTVPTAADVQTANGGAIGGRPELNDTITYTSSEPMDPNSILAGWTGATTDVVARIDNNIVSGNDRLRVYNSTNVTLLNFSSVNLGRLDYVTANTTFGVTGTKAKMTMTGSTITVVLGTQSAAGTTAAAAGTMCWTPAAGPTDPAGNALSLTARSETGVADADF